MEIRGGEVTKIYKEGIFEGSTVEVIIEERRKRCSIYDMEVIYCCEFVPTTATTSTTVALTTTATSTTTMIPTSIQTTTILTTAQATSVPTTRPTTTITIPTEMTTVTETTKVPTTITPQAAGSCEMEKRNVLEWAIGNSLPCQFPSSDLEITTCKGICESFTQGHVEFVNGPFINPVRSCQCCGGTGSFINITGINCTGPGFISNQTQTLTVFVYDSCSCQEGHCFTGNGLSSTTVKTTPAPLCDPKLPYVYVKPKSRNNFRIILQLQSGQPVTDRNIRDLISDKIFWSPPAILQKGFSIKMDILEECSTQWIILGVKFQMKGVRTYSVAVGNTLVSDYEDAEEGLSKFVKEGTYYGSSLVITIHKRFKEMYINCVEMVACCGSTTIEMAILAD